MPDQTPRRGGIDGYQQLWSLWTGNLAVRGALVPRCAPLVRTRRSGGGELVIQDEDGRIRQRAPIGAAG